MILIVGRHHHAWSRLSEQRLFRRKNGYESALQFKPTHTRLSYACPVFTGRSRQ